ncbi:hypothetical protein CANARDRAFT_190988, partial [[Candida] arabinofermentans NRRL YB-2248]
LRSTLSSLKEYLTPINHKSTFTETGEITPEEFIEAGDHIVNKFPTWQWSPAPESKKRDFLPDDKQFLVTRHVPSYVRAGDFEDDDTNLEDIKEVDDDDDDDEEEEGWTTTINHHKNPNKHHHCTPDDERRHSQQYDEMVEKINDIDDLIDENAEEEMEKENNNSKPINEATVIDPNKRSYDLYITYSTSYRVPKMYLVGFNSNGTPLTPNEMFEDIASDYRQKTVTIEKAPFLSNTTSVSIHPCKHATVMKVLMKRAILAAKDKLIEEKNDLIKGVSKLGLAGNDEDDDAEDVDDDDDWEASVVKVNQYMIIFLKFIASVTPGIEHDYTMDA